MARDRRAVAVRYPVDDIRAAVDWALRTHATAAAARWQLPAPLRFAVFTDLRLAPRGTPMPKWTNSGLLPESRGLLHAAIADAAKSQGFSSAC